MIKATVAGFVAFVNDQPSSRRVDHTSWETCAVGDYSREVLNRQPVAGSELLLGNGAVAPGTVVRELWEETGTSHPEGAKSFGQKPRRSRSLMDELRLADKGRQNYGQLRTAMAERFPELGFVNKPGWFMEWSREWLHKAGLSQASTPI